MLTLCRAERDFLPLDGGLTDTVDSQDSSFGNSS